MSKLFTPEFYLEDLRTKFQKLQRTGVQYYLSYSGGRDSHLLLWFMRNWLRDRDPELYVWCNENIKVVGCNTYLEHSEILDRMKKHCDIILIPKMKPLEIKAKYGIPCFSKEQDAHIYYYQMSLSKGKQPCKTVQCKIDGTYHTGFCLSKIAQKYVKSGLAHKISHLCCKFLKKEPFRLYEKETGRKAILGIRSSESILRKQRYKSCFTKDNKFTPLHDLDDGTLEAIIAKWSIEVPKIYKYVTRTGCVGCPYGSWKKDTVIELAIIPLAQRKFVCELFKESYEVLGIDTSSDLPFVEVAPEEPVPPAVGVEADGGAGSGEGVE